MPAAPVSAATSQRAFAKSAAALAAAGMGWGDVVQRTVWLTPDCSEGAAGAAAAGATGGALACATGVVIDALSEGCHFEVEVVAPEAYFLSGTILEGELVSHQPENGTILFLVFDCVLSRGESYVARPFSDRLAEAHRCTRHSEELCQLGSGELEAKAADADAVVLVHFRPHIVMQPKHFVERAHAARLLGGRMRTYSSLRAAHCIITVGREGGGVASWPLVGLFGTSPLTDD